MKTKTRFAAAAMLATAVVLPASLRAAAAPAPAANTKDEPVVLSIFQVSSKKDEGYRSTQTVSGSRTLADLRDTPNSISVLNRELLDQLVGVMAEVQARVPDAAPAQIDGLLRVKGVLEEIEGVMGTKPEPARRFR